MANALPLGDLTCPNGGVLLKTGIDENRNGVLDDPAEVDSTQKICNGAAGPAGPGLPMIQSLHVIGVPANPGASISGAVSAQSSDGLALSYAWAATGGWSIVGPANQATVTLQAPASYASAATATVTVTDSQARQAVGTVSLATIGNLAPVISAITGGPVPLERRRSAQLRVYGADPNGDSLAYTWTVPAGYTIVAGQGTSEVTVTTARFGGGFAQVAISDGAATTTAGLYVSTRDGAWGTAQLIETDNAGTAGDPRVAMDASGNGIAVWIQSDGSRDNVWANRYLNGAGWGTAQLIETDNAGDAVNPRVALDANGNAIAVWQQFDGTRVNIWANRYVAGAGWGTAQLIVTANPVGAGDAQVTVAPNGNAVAVWAQSDGTRPSIWANRYVAGTGWGTAQLIEGDDTGPASDAQVAIDANGNAIAVWWQSDGTRFNIWANRYVAGTGWGAVQLIESDNAGSASFPQVAMDPNGNAVAVWQQSDGTRLSIWANRYVAGTGWGTAQLIETDNAGNASFPQVAIDANGNALAVWQQSDGTRENIWVNRYVAGTGWGTAQLIETENAGIAQFPHVAVDQNGNALTVWYQFDGERFNIWANRYVAGTGWDTAQILESDNLNSGSVPDVAMDANGNAIAVWQQFDGTRFNIWANAFE